MLLDSEHEYQLTGQVFVKGLALIYLAAFWSIAVQIVGLAGINGILPFNETLSFVQQQYGYAGWWRLPTVFWLSADDIALQGAAVGGCVISTLLFFGRLQRSSLIVLFILYLSLFHAGQIFLNFQWDFLLLEAGFLAIFIGRCPSRLLIFLFHWLLFRLRFLSGVSKIISDDPSWSGLTALNTYFETQPLPHVGAWFAHQLPTALLQAGTAFVLFAELIVPFMIFLPRNFRLLAAAITIALQVLIIATSNHNFVNLLTILLCLFLLDDRIVARFIPGRTQQQKKIGHLRATPLAALLIMPVSILSMVHMLSPQPLPEPLSAVVATGQRFGIGNVYHIFPTMQTQRQELQIEGSTDGVVWKPYVFHYKPGEVDIRPVFNVPHHPRLDWMMWFVPMQNPGLMFWFDRFMWRLWTNEPSVTALLRHNPFSESAPRYLRVSAWRYEFTSIKVRRESGNWWKREYIGQFPNVPPRRP